MLAFGLFQQLLWLVRRRFYKSDSEEFTRAYWEALILATPSRASVILGSIVSALSKAFLASANSRFCSCARPLVIQASANLESISNARSASRIALYVSDIAKNETNSSQSSKTNTTLKPA